MSNEMIALLELVTVGGMGVLLMLASGLMYAFQKKKCRNCSEMIPGQVIKHSFPGGGRMFPVVRYTVDGREYKVKRKFAGIVTKQKVSPTHLYSGSGAYVSDRGYLHVPTSAITNLRDMAQALWPIGSDMTVYYNPNNPKQAYAEQKPKKMSLEMIVFLLAGAFVVLLSIGMYFVIRLT